MKKFINHILLIMMGLFITGITACKKNDGYNTVVSTDKTKPEVVTDIKVQNYNGGSFITYKLPKSENILYVLAKYQIRDGVNRETKASYFSDTLNADGFAKGQEYEVTLYTVSRANIMSDPVSVTVHPKTPIFKLVKETCTLETDFGGIRVSALNTLKKEVGIIVTKFDSLTNRMEIIDQHYTNADTIDYSVRGLNTDPRDFGVYITDRYGNLSDTLKKTISPLFEQLLDKNLFSNFKLPSDTEIGYGWEVSNIWNNSNDGSQAGWHTQPGNTAPFVCSFNVGKLCKLSRFILWERPDNGSEKFAFGHGNPHYFTLWGSSAASPKDIKLPVSSAVGTKLGDWVNLGNFIYPPPPSGASPDNHTESDNAFVAAGVNFNVSLNAPSIHFIRVAVAQSWSKGDFAHFMEISLYGKPQ